MVPEMAEWWFSNEESDRWMIKTCVFQNKFVVLQSKNKYHSDYELY